VTGQKTIGATSTNQDSVESRLSFWLSWAVLLAGVGSGIVSAYIVITTYSPLPHWDEWALFYDLANGLGSLSWLWQQHNEHRILTTRLLFLLDVDLFHGTQVFLLASIFLTQLLQVGLLSWSLRKLGGLRGSAWRVGTGLIAYCILCPTQYENLVWGFQVQFVLPAAMATLAFVSLLLYWRGERAWLLILAVAAATIATWSLANGMLLWPLLVIAALWIGLKRPVWLALSACGAINIGLFFFHYHFPPHDDTQPYLSLGQRILYVPVYFGSTFVRHSSGTVVVLAGLVGIVASLVVILRVLRQRAGASPFLLEMSLLLTMCLATAAITSTGRMHLGVQQATASRYQTFALLFWCCIGLVLLVRLSSKPVVLVAFASVLMLMMIGFATQTRKPLVDAQERQLRLKMMEVALLADVQDPAALINGYPNPQVVVRGAEYMRQHGLSIFHGKQFEQLGQPIDRAYRVVPATECSGYITTQQHSPGQGDVLRITGFAWDQERSRPARDVVAAVDGQVRGFGTNVTIPLRLKKVRSDANPAWFGWIAYVQQVRPGSPVRFYALLGKDEACPLAAARP
jgi:hypothetical protein